MYFNTETHKYKYTTTHNTEFIFHLNYYKGSISGLTLFCVSSKPLQNREKKFFRDPVSEITSFPRKKLDHAYLVFPRPKHYSTFLHTLGVSERVVIVHTPVKL